MLFRTIKPRSNQDAFGMQMPSRTYQASGVDGYRFGFNGQEQDNEVSGEGNSLDFGARIYDSRVGRWLSTDPLQKKYPKLTPYHFTDNNPILFVDYDGKDYGIKVNNEKKTITITATVYTTKAHMQEAQAAVGHWNKQSGKYQVQVKNVVKKGFLGIGREVTKELYDVNFKIDVVSKKNFGERDDAYELDNSGLANTYNVSMPTVNLTSPDGEDVEGYVASEDGLNRGVSRAYVEYGAQKRRKTGSHEVGHFIGVPHWNKGIMEDGETRETGEEEVTKGMVNEILSKVGITKHKNFSMGGNSDSSKDTKPNGAKATFVGADRIKGKSKVKVK